MSEQETKPVLAPNEVLASIQTLIAENLSNGEDVRNVICALAGDLLVNGFKTEHLEGRVAMGIGEGGQLTALVGITVEVFQKVNVTAQPQPNAAAPEVETAKSEGDQPK